MLNIKSILVPISFAPSCWKAMEMASRVAAASNAKLYVMNVYKTPPRLFYSVGGVLFSKSMEQERSDNIKRLDEFVRNEMKRLKLSLDVEEIEVEDERPADAIINFAGEKNIDLIVLGHHEETRLEHFLFGRNIHDIVDGAPCDVIVTRTKLYERKERELPAA